MVAATTLVPPPCPLPAETSPEQRGSEVHTKKTVMIKTIETRDGEVSTGPEARRGPRSVPGPLVGLGAGSGGATAAPDAASPRRW